MTNLNDTLPVCARVLTDSQRLAFAEIRDAINREVKCRQAFNASRGHGALYDLSVAIEELNRADQRYYEEFGEFYSYPRY